MASRGYCWGRHLLLTPKAFGYEQGGGEATCEGEEGALEGLGAKCDKRRPMLPEEKQRGGVRSEGTVRVPKGPTTKRLRGPLHLSSEDTRSRREVKRPHCQNIVRSVQL